MMQKLSSKVHQVLVYVTEGEFLFENDLILFTTTTFAKSVVRSLADAPGSFYIIARALALRQQLSPLPKRISTLTTHISPTISKARLHIRVVSLGWCRASLIETRSNIQITPSVSTKLIPNFHGVCSIASSNTHRIQEALSAKSMCTHPMLYSRRKMWRTVLELPNNQCQSKI